MTSKPPWTISVATYNVLADAYIKPKYYPLCATEDFKPERRHPLLDARVAALGTDVICLQEVDYEAFKRFDDRLRPLGYQGRWAHRAGGKPDGCATFVRAPWKLRTSLIFDFDDEPRRPSNRVAIASVIECDGHRRALVNAHLQWDPPDAPPHEQAGLGQALQLLSYVRGQGRAVVCGDFNAVPDSAILEAFRTEGFTDAHGDAPPTSNTAGPPRKIDFLLHSYGLVAIPSPPPHVAAGTPLPSATEPSDHVPLIATFATKPG